MDGKCKALCDKLADCIVQRDFKGVHALLAPWLQATLGPSEIEEMVDTANEGLSHPPHAWTIDEGLVGLEDLREPDDFGPPSGKLAKAITEDNFRGWLSIQFTPDPSVHEEQNVCFDIWLVAVEHNGAVLAGYLEAAEAS